MKFEFDIKLAVNLALEYCFNTIESSYEKECIVQHANIKVTDQLAHERSLALFCLQHLVEYPLFIHVLSEKYRTRSSRWYSTCSKAQCIFSDVAHLIRKQRLPIPI